MPLITETGNTNNSHQSEALEGLSYEFIPYIQFSKENYKSDFNDNENDTISVSEDETVSLGNYFKEEFKNRKLDIVEIAGELVEEKEVDGKTVKTDKIYLAFDVLDGTGENYDSDGTINILITGDDADKVTITEPKELPIPVEFSDDFLIELSLDIKNNEKDIISFFVDFKAKDNGGDYFDGDIEGDLENLFCGRVKIEYKELKYSKVGLKLTSNIEALPLAPSNYISPPTFSDPKKSFEVANKYQNSYGMCFAVSMARVKKAYQDEFNVEVLSLDLRNNDYLYSGTIVTSIPDKYLAYGVGGALASKGYATLIDEEGVKNGSLEEGAMLQYWNIYESIDLTTLKQAIKDSINQIENENFNGGHSVIFKSYIKDESNNITGMNIYDYSGIGRSYSFADNSEIFLGANLKDIE